MNWTLKFHTAAAALLWHWIKDWGQGPQSAALMANQFISQALCNGLCTLLMLLNKHSHLSRTDEIINQALCNGLNAETRWS